MSTELTERVKAFARGTGLDLVGVTTTEPFDRYLSELTQRESHYSARYAYRLEGWRTLARPREALPDARAVLVLGYYYYTDEPEPMVPFGRFGRIVTYGHLGILKRAKQVRGFLKEQGYDAVIGAHRKEAAMRAGLGFVGKNGLVLNSTFGGWVAYQSLVTNAPLAADEPFTDDLCGNCDACLRACPTRALYEPRRLDPRRCVTCLLTSDSVPEEHWAAFGNYILGCDACLDACPKNQKLPGRPDAESLFPEGIGMHPPLRKILSLDQVSFRKEILDPVQEKIAGRSFLGTLLRNPVAQRVAKWLAGTVLRGREVLPETFVHASGKLMVYKRNALIAAGNVGAADVRELVDACRVDPSLRRAAEWALERMP